jgi:FixJ family two-component response regulator
MISIVDDDKSIREAAKTLVRSLGYSAATFSSAEEFLESGRLDETSCLITDVQMSGMSGVDLQNHLIAKGDCTPVIFVTAFPESGLRERALRAGAVGFLSKPFREESYGAPPFEKRELTPSGPNFRFSHLSRERPACPPPCVVRTPPSHPT